jgi:hypothetical protein
MGNTKRYGTRATPPGPAPYSHTDHSEARAISCLNDLLAQPETKSHISQRDKTPNVDGFIEIVDVASRPLGKLEVQVKHLGTKDLRRRGYSCKLPFLHYCASAPLPVLLLGVSPDQRKALWREVTRAEARVALSTAGSRKAVTVRFPANNTISANTRLHIEPWRRIVEEHNRKLVLYDSSDSETQRLRALASCVEQVGHGFPDVQGVDPSRIQIHLDELNTLLDTSFSFVKNKIFPGAWKLGLAYAHYSSTSLVYCYYPVRNGANDLLLRRVSPETFVQLQHELVDFPHSNPIEDDPKGLAREFVKDETLRLVDGMQFDFDDIVLCREQLFCLVDAMEEPLGISRNVSSLRVKTLRNAWEHFLPAWLSYAMRTLPKRITENILSVSRFHEFIDPGSFAFALRMYVAKTRREIAMVVREQQPRRTTAPPTSLPLGIRGLPLVHIERLLELLSSRGVTTIDRLFTRFNYKRPGRWVSDWWTPSELFHNTQLFYSELPRLYDHVVQKTFPALRDDLTYYNDFDRELIYVKPGTKNHGPWLNFCTLRGGNRKRTDVMLGKSSVPSPSGSRIRVRINRTSYDVVSTGSSSAMFMFHPIPLLTSIRDELKRQISSLDILKRTSPRVPQAATKGQIIRISRRP